MKEQYKIYEIDVSNHVLSSFFKEGKIYIVSACEMPSDLDEILIHKRLEILKSINENGGKFFKSGINTREEAEFYLKSIPYAAFW